MSSCRSFIDRYFTRRYSVDVMGKSKEDLCLAFHSNGVSVLTLAPSHPIIVDSPSSITIESVDYKVTGKLDRSDNKVSGKSKRGAQALTADAPVCKIVCRRRGSESGSGSSAESVVVYTIRACMNGRLIEVNERLIREPQLLVTHPDTLGYICVIAPKKRFPQQQQPQFGHGGRDQSPEAGAAEGEDHEVDQQPKSTNTNLIDRQSYLKMRFPEEASSIVEEEPRQVPIEDMGDS